MPFAIEVVTCSIGVGTTKFQTTHAALCQNDLDLKRHIGECLPSSVEQRTVGLVRTFVLAVW
jgi:hypothetical protein